jgi:CBS domain-containing protein
LPVCNGDRLVGMVTDRDIAVRAVAKGTAPGDRVVRDVMSEAIRFAFQDDEIAEVADKMAEWQVRRLPISIATADIALEAKDEVRTGLDNDL